MSRQSRTRARGRQLTSEMHLARELEAITRGVQQQVAELQRQVATLHQLMNGGDELEHPSDILIWTQGGAARRVAEIGSLLSRRQALQEALSLLTALQE